MKFKIQPEIYFRTTNEFRKAILAGIEQEETRPKVELILRAWVSQVIFVAFEAVWQLFSVVGVVQ